jgi:hypothetical protein
MECTHGDKELSWNSISKYFSTLLLKNDLQRKNIAKHQLV